MAALTLLRSNVEAATTLLPLRFQLFSRRVCDVNMHEASTSDFLTEHDLGVQIDVT